MNFLKAKTDKDLIIKSTMLLLGLNFILANLLIITKIPALSEDYTLIFFGIEFVIFVICIIFGLCIKKENIDILKQNDLYGMKVISTTGLILSVLSLFFAIDFYTGMLTLFYTTFNFDIDALEIYVNHFGYAFFPISMSLGLFAVFGTSTSKEFNITKEIIVLRRQKTKNMVAFLSVCCVCLLAYKSTLITHLPGGGRYEKSMFGYGSSFSARTMHHLFYQERGDEIYYIFEGAEENITEYCSATDYFLTPVTDAKGNGYIAIVGGDAGERGMGLLHYDKGEFYVGQWDSELYDIDINTNFYKFENCQYPTLTWAHHATHSIGNDLSTEFFANKTLPDTITLEYGTANKISDIGYHVVGYDLGFYVYSEVEDIVYDELDFLRSKYDAHYVCSYIDGFPYSENEFSTAIVDENSPPINISIYTETDPTIESATKNVLDELGYLYEIEFIGEAI